MPVVSIVGYTNAGKSTLLNPLTGADVLVEDKLFATLDPASRRLRFPPARESSSPTPSGFIRKLPAELVAASAPPSRSSTKLTCSSTSSTQARRTPRLTLRPWRRSWRTSGPRTSPRSGFITRSTSCPIRTTSWPSNSGRPDTDRIFVSAKTGEGVEALKARLRTLLFQSRKLFYLRLPAEDRGVLEALARKALILKTQESNGQLDVRVIAAPESLTDFGPYLQGGEEDRKSQK